MHCVSDLIAALLSTSTTILLLSIFSTSRLLVTSGIAKTSAWNTVLSSLLNTVLQSSNLLFRRPLHKLRCNFFGYLIVYFYRRVIYVPKRRVAADTILHSSLVELFCSLVQLLGNGKQTLRRMKPPSLAE